MDEIVLRVIVQRGDGASGPASTQPASAPTSPRATVPVPPPQSAAVMSAPSRRDWNFPPPRPQPGKTNKPFDPVEAALRKIEKEDQRDATEVEYAKLKPAPLPSLKMPFDPLAAAMKRVEREDQMAAVDAEYAKLRPAVVPTFNPVAEAQKRLDAEKRRAAVDAEYAKLNPPPPFDPTAEADKRRRREQQRAQADAAYDAKYGTDQKSWVDQILKVIEPLRGTIGGVFGTVVGAAADAVVGIRRLRAEDARNKKRQELLAEAAKTATTTTTPPTAGTSGPTAPPVAATVPPLPTAATTTTPTSSAGTTGGAGGGGGGGTIAGAAGASGSAAGGAAAGTAAMALGKFAVVAIIAVGVIKAFTATLEALDKAAERFGQYNPQIAQSLAIAEIRQVMGDLRRAQTLSREMSQYVLAKSEVQQKWEDAKAAFMNAALPIITDILKVLSVLMSAGEGVAEAVSAIVTPLKSIAAVMSRILGIQEDARNTRKVLDPTDVILGDTPEARGAREGMYKGVGDFGNFPT